MNDYPPNWKEIAQRVKADAGWLCIRCGHSNDPKSGHVLTVHHLDNDKANCRWWNLAALCQRCHLKVQGSVNMSQQWPFEHSEWFKPYAAGWYAFKYLNEDLTRVKVMKRLDELLALERKF